MPRNKPVQRGPIPVAWLPSFDGIHVYPFDVTHLVGAEVRYTRVYATCAERAMEKVRGPVLEVECVRLTGSEILDLFGGEIPAPVAPPSWVNR